MKPVTQRLPICLWDYECNSRSCLGVHPQCEGSPSRYEPPRSVCALIRWNTLTMELLHHVKYRTVCVVHWQKGEITPPVRSFLCLKSAYMLKICICWFHSCPFDSIPVIETRTWSLVWSQYRWLLIWQTNHFDCPNTPVTGGVTHLYDG